MKIEKWTLGLAAIGLVSLSPALVAQTTNATPPAPIIPLQTALTATTISGYVDTSAVWNPGTGNANPAPYAFNAGKQDGFNVNAVDVRIAKAEDESQWATGYVVELSYGPDAAAIDGGAYPIRQAYVELKTPIGNGIDWQFGRWDNLLGYESSDSYKNPNYTRSYGYSFEPTEHTGLLGSYKFCDAVNLQVGVADTVTTLGLNSRAVPGAATTESKKALISLLTLTAPDSWGSFKGSAFYVGFDLGQGDANFDPAGAVVKPHDRSELYLGATINTPVKDLTFGASWDSIEHTDVGAIDSSYFQAFAGYASYKLTDKLTLNGRLEYADGQALGVNADANNGVPLNGLGEATPNPLDKVLAATGTLQYDLWANVISRLEIRWDHAANGSDAFGGIGALGTALPSKKNDVMLAANVIYKF
jgi:hypothetical protein